LFGGDEGGSSGKHEGRTTAASCCKGLLPSFFVAKFNAVLLGCVVHSRRGGGKNALHELSRLDAKEVVLDVLKCKGSCNYACILLAG
jgi:hypothetical protein